jgi:hypothetical protein
MANKWKWNGMWEPLGDDRNTTNWITIIGFAIVVGVITAKANRSEFEAKLDKLPPDIRAIVEEEHVSIEQAQRMAWGRRDEELRKQAEERAKRRAVVSTVPAAATTKNTMTVPKGTSPRKIDVSKLFEPKPEQFVIPIHEPVNDFDAEPYEPPQ